MAVETHIRIEITDLQFLGFFKLFSYILSISILKIDFCLCIFAIRAILMCLFYFLLFSV